MDSFVLGKLGAGLLVFAWGALMLKRGSDAATRAGKLGNSAAGFSLLAFLSAAVGANFPESPNREMAMVITGTAAIVLAIVACVTGIGALRARQSGDPAGYIAPVLGLLFGLLNILGGVGVAGMGTRLLVPRGGGTPFVWYAEKDGYEVTFPSERWQQAARPQGRMKAEFHCPNPSMVLGVLDVLPARTDGEFAAAIAKARSAKAGEKPITKPTERLSNNTHGNTSWLYICDATGRNGDYVAGLSVTRVRGKAIVLLFEGQHRMTSQTGKEQETQEFHTQAEQILGSVK